jgi:hypothetical protein
MERVHLGAWDIYIIKHVFKSQAVKMWSLKKTAQDKSSIIGFSDDSNEF